MLHAPAIFGKTISSRRADWHTFVAGETKRQTESFLAMVSLYGGGKTSIWVWSGAWWTGVRAGSLFGLRSNCEFPKMREYHLMARHDLVVGNVLPLKLCVCLLRENDPLSSSFGHVL
jgi:hypothetical protein